MPGWPRFQEPLRVTLTRTIGIALIGGGIIALSTGGVRRWPFISLLMLWPAVGGHWVELFFLNWLRVYLPQSAATYRAVRVGVWFVGGVLLAIGVHLTARMLLGRWALLRLTWGVAGAIFVAVELVAHAGLHLRGRPSFYDALG